MFKGRREQLTRVVAATQEVGQHAIVYGERGVGKTSLSNMARASFARGSQGTSLSVRIPCTAADDFESVWQRLVPRLNFELDSADREVAAALSTAVARAEDILLPDAGSPEAVARALHVVSARIPLLVIVDEFDRIAEPPVREAFADLIKTLSDDQVRCTLLVVGVADDVEGLIQGHRSIERNLRQIYMPRMSRDELALIVTDGFAEFSAAAHVQLSVDEAVPMAITHLSQGFPYYAHLLASSVGATAIMTGTTTLGRGVVFESLFGALEEASQAIKVSFTDAVTAARSDATLGRTLAACSMARVDELGFFAPADVCAPLSDIMGTPRTTSNFLHHLRRFNGPPSWILETRGSGRGARYRFSNPLMKPFVLMKAIDDGLVELPDER